MLLVTVRNTLAPSTHASTQSFSKSWSQLPLNNQKLLCLIHLFPSQMDGPGCTVPWLPDKSAICTGPQLTPLSCFYLRFNSLDLYCHVSRWSKSGEGVQALPGQPAQPEQHLRPALCLHQHVLWTSCQGDTHMISR